MCTLVMKQIPSKKLFRKLLLHKSAMNIIAHVLHMKENYQ